jgi:AcrR family transcriptional regulator
MHHEKVDVIFQAAVEVFAESGFDQAKMDEIAQTAGVAKGTIYYHFKSKEELFVGLMNEGIQRLVDCAKSNIDLHRSPTAQLKALIESHVHFFVQNSKLAKLLLGEAFGTKERQRKFREKIRLYLRLIESVLKDGVKKREFVVEHPQETASAIFGAASVVVLQKIYSMEGVNEKEIEAMAPTMIETLHHLLLTSITKSPQL